MRSPSLPSLLTAACIFTTASISAQQLLAAENPPARSAAPTGQDAPAAKNAPPAPAANANPEAKPRRKRKDSPEGDASSQKPKTEDERFNAARKKASSDPHVVDLQKKADSTATNEAMVDATRAYLQALYAKMKELEPTLSERIDLTETAAIRNLERSK